jgi:hypothetical protein
MRFQVLTAASMKAKAFWDIELCSLVEVDVSEVLTASIIRAMMMKVVCTSETSVYFNETTRPYITESCHLHKL